MYNDRFMYNAVDKVLLFLRQRGVKFQRSDFNFNEQTGNFVAFTSDRTYIIVWISYEDSGEKGKKLQKITDVLLDDSHVRIIDRNVLFTYSIDELVQAPAVVAPDNVNIENIMKRVEKLLSLADPKNNINENEAISASIKAQELLAKYKIDLDQLGDEEDIIHITMDVPKGEKWKYDLAATVAKAYCTKVYRIGSNRIVFFGYTSDSIMARRIFNYLFKTGGSLARKYVKEYAKSHHSTDGAYNSFCKGFIAGVNQNLSESSKALMLIVPPKVDEEFKKIKFSKNQDTHIKSSNKAAYRDGFFEGGKAMGSRYIEN